MDHFFEESAANVFARLVAVDALLAELYVLGCRAAQTVQSVGKEESALLQDSRTDVKYVKVVLRVCWKTTRLSYGQFQENVSH